jgi:hypothetical protein
MRWREGVEKSFKKSVLIICLELLSSKSFTALNRARNPCYTGRVWLLTI